MGDVKIYASDDLNCSNLGLGVLTGVTDCEVTRQTNGQWECVFGIAINSQHYSEIGFGKKIKVKADEKAGYQQFRIYKITKPDLKGIVKVYCEHISYDLSRLTVKPLNLTGQGATAAISAILNNCTSQTHNFSGQGSTVTGTKNIKSDVPRTARSWLSASENSIVDLFNCELEFDNYTITAKPQIGEDNGVKILYGKNLQDVNDESNSDTAFNAIYPYAVVNEHYYELPEKVLALTNNLPFTEIRCIPVDLSEKFDENTTITSELLRSTALTYAGQARLTKTNRNIKVSFEQLWNTKEYETLSALERVGLGDTVYVHYGEYGIDVTARVNKIVYDVLNEKYKSIELGRARKTITETISQNREELQAAIEDASKKQKSVAQKMIEHQTALISGSEGGYVVNTYNNQSKPEKILIMDTDNQNTATKILWLTKDGIGFSNGINGQITTGWGIDGTFNASFITTGTLDASLVNVTNINANNITTGALSANKIVGGTLVDAAGNFTLNLSNGKIQMISDNSGNLVIWREGITIYHSDNSVATSMFLSADDTGALTAEHILVGTRGSERIHLYVNNNKGTITSDECAFTDSIGYYNDASSTYKTVVSASNGDIKVDTDYITVQQNIKVFNDVEIRKLNGLKFGSNNYGPVNITIDGVSYTVIAQRNS